MTLPMLVAVPLRGESAPGTATSRAFRAAAAAGEIDGSFELAFGAMIASTPARNAPADSSIELVLDGEWRVDPEPSAEEAAGLPATSPEVAEAANGDDGVVVPLGKSLETWLAAAGHRSAPVATEVRHGAAEEMIDLVPIGISTGLPDADRSSPESAAVEAPVPTGAANQLGDRSRPPAVPIAQEPGRVGGSQDPVVGELPLPGAPGRVPRGDSSVDPAPDGLAGDPLTVATEAVEVPNRSGWGASSNQSVTTVYHERLLGNEAADEEPALPHSGPGRERLGSRTAAGNPGLHDQRTAPMDLDEGLDPDALLARYQARHPAVEIGGFAFPLDLPETVAEEAVAPPTGRGRAESAEVSAYERLRSQVLGGQGEGHAGSRRHPGAEGNGRESGGQAAEQRAVAATRALDDLRVARAPAPLAEPAAGAVRRETGEAVLLAAPTTAPQSVDSDGPEIVPVARPAAGPAPADPGDRIARRVEHLMLNIADEQGDYGRLKVSVTGTSVRATIMPNDPALAERLTVDLRQLRQQLGDRGFADATVTVQAPKAVDGGVSSSTLLVRDVVDTTGFETRMTDRPRAEDQRRESPRDPRDPEREEQRPSHRSRDQKQHKRGGQE